MPNQFSNPTPLEAYEVYMTKGLHRLKVSAIANRLKKAPNICFVVDRRPFVWMRHENKRYALSTRNLIYYILHGTVPKMGVVTCGNKGCVNPNHQTVLEE